MPLLYLHVVYEDNKIFKKKNLKTLKLNFSLPSSCSWLQAMESVTVETVTARLVGMEINVNSSVTSAHGRVSGDAHLQMARSAATEVCLCASIYLTLT